MDARIEAGPLTSHVVAIVSEPVVSVEINVSSSVAIVLTWTRFSPSPISINGHSLNAINPDFIEVGELTTSALA